MVTGIEKFRSYFAGHEGKYAIIGGTACDLLFEEAGLPFRATKDIDLVLCVEVVDANFGRQIAAFLEAGGYQTRERSDGSREYFRFSKPTDKAFPFMIEVFARAPATLDITDDARVIRIPVENEALSLSALLLNDDYFSALQSGKRVIGGVSLIDEYLLIPFKARAFLDMADRKAEGGDVDSKNINKHRNDVFRLAQLLRTDMKFDVPASIREDIQRFVERVETDSTLDPKSFGVAMTCQQAAALLRAVYSIGQSGID